MCGSFQVKFIDCVGGGSGGGEALYCSPYIIHIIPVTLINTKENPSTNRGKFPLVVRRECFSGLSN